MNKSFSKKSIRYLLSMLAVISLTLLLCVGCAPEDYEDEEEPGVSSQRTVSSAVSDNSQGADSTPEIVYSAVQKARRTEDGFYDKKPDGNNKIDLRAYSPETNADLFLRVEDYINVMNNMTSILNNLPQGVDTSAYYAIEQNLEKMAMELEDEIMQSNIPGKYRKNVKTARENMSAAAKTAFSASGKTDVSSQETSSNEQIENTSSANTSSDPSSQGRKEKEDDEITDPNGSSGILIAALVIVTLILIIVIVVFFYGKNDKKNTEGSNKQMAEKRGIFGIFGGKSSKKERRSNMKQIETSEMETIRPTEEQPDYNDLSYMDINAINNTAVEEQAPIYRDEVPQQSVEAEPPKDMYNINYFVRTCNEISQSGDAASRKARVKELVRSCRGRASFVYCTNENEVINSPSSTIPIFVDSDTITMYIRHGTYLIPSPAIQMERDKRNMSLYADVTSEGRIWVHNPARLKKVGDNEYSLESKGNWGN